MIHKNTLKSFNIIKFNRYFLLFCSFIFLVATFWLYKKHLVSNDSTISEWLINYQGGFTRRGLIGEICFKIADYLDLKIRYVIFIFQALIYLIFISLIYRLIKNIPKNTLTIIAIFSPLFLFYPVAEIEVLARKEIFLFCGFIIFLNLASLKKSKKNLLIYIFLIFPILILIWEPFIFFIPFVIFIIFIQNTEDSLIKLLLKTLISLSSSLFMTLYIVTNLLSPDQHDIMSNTLMNRFSETCYMSCALLKNKSSITAQYTAVFQIITFEAVFRYFLIMLVGFSPLLILFYNSTIKIKNIFFEKFKNLLIPYLIVLVIPLILFMVMTDWGRIVNMIYTFSLLTFLYLLKNNLITLNKKIFYFDNFYNNKKKIFIILFYIFAFCWNPKTSVTGDIATNSLYKVIYNSSKKIFDFKSIHLFKDSPILKFHQKYIE